MRKRYKYGTVIIDADIHEVIDLINSRITEEVEECLRKYPNIKEISRDGGSIYKSAGAKAHPNAIQVSDRFHIIESLEKCIVNILKKQLNKIIVFGADKEKYNDSLKELDLGVARTYAERARQKEKRDQKIETIENAKRIYSECKNYKEVSRQLGISEPTAQKYVKCEEPGDCLYKSVEHKNRLTKIYENTIKELDKKGYSGHKIYAIIKKDGYIGCHSNVKDYLRRLHRENKKLEEVEEKLERKYVEKAVFKGIDEIIEITNKKENKDLKVLFDKVMKEYPTVGNVFNLLSVFKKMMFVDKDSTKLDNWIEEAKKLNIQTLDEFTNGIVADIDAVKNGIKYNSNNGLAEGFVNKIKVIKRVMYGRAGFDLLKQKIFMI